MLRLRKLFSLIALLAMILAACEAGAEPTEQEAVTTEPPAATQAPDDTPTDQPTEQAPVRGDAGIFEYTGEPIGDLDGEPLIADTGFRPQVQGFSFPNYGDELPAGNLTIAEVRSMFGEGVCAQIKGDTCVPTPAAQMWIDEMNAAMAGGHCEGFAVLSLRFLAGQADAGQFDPTAAMGFELDPSDTAALRQIAADWTTQAIEPVASITGEIRQNSTPNDILDRLFRAMRSGDELYTLGIYSEEGGHAVTPIAIGDQGGGVYRVYVYDNNYPGESKYVEFDTGANAWTYSLAALNPAEDSAPWSGDAETFSLDLTPLSSRDPSLYVCPICDGEPVAAGEGTIRTIGFSERPAGAAGRDTQVIARGSGRVRITNPQGEEIAGVKPARPKGALFNRNAPWFFVPAGTDYRVVFGGEGGDERITNVVMFRPAFAVSLGNLASGQEQSIQFEGDESRFNFTSGGDEQPSVAMAVDLDGSSYFFVVNGADLADGESLDFGVDPDTGRMSFNDSDGETGAFDLIVMRIDDDGISTFAYADLEVGPDGEMVLDFGEWDGEGAMPAGMDEDGDGQSDESMDLESQSLADLLDAADGIDDLRDLLDDVGAYLDPRELADLIEASGVPMDEWAGLLSELPADEWPDVLDSLGVSPEDQDQILGQLDDLDDGDDADDGDAGGDDGGDGGDDDDPSDTQDAGDDGDSGGSGDGGG